MSRQSLARPQAVIFDIGNVLIEWQPEARYDKIVGPKRRAAMFAAVDLHAMNEELDGGGDFREVIYATARQYPEFEAEIRMWHDRWSELARPAIDGSVRLLRALRRTGIPVFALTNFGRGSFAVSEADYDFLSEFDRRYISGYMGVTKPDPRIYEMVERDCGIDPGLLLFTDDKQDNIATARARGWQTHLFDGPAGWSARLVAAGLISKDDAV